MKQLDSLDRQILVELEGNARISNLDLARKLEAPNSTVRDRIRRLEESGIIQAYRAVIDYEKLGFGIKAIVQVTRESAIPLENTLNGIEGLPEIQTIQFVTGETDELVTIFLRDIDHLKDVLFTKFSNWNWKAKLNTLIVMEERNFPFIKNMLASQKKAQDSST